jgi:hypothetical protein
MSLYNQTGQGEFGTVSDIPAVDGKNDNLFLQCKKLGFLNKDVVYS